MGETTSPTMTESKAYGSIHGQSSEISSHDQPAPVSFQSAVQTGDGHVNVYDEVNWTGLFQLINALQVALESSKF